MAPAQREAYDGLRRLGETVKLADGTFIARGPDGRTIGVYQDIRSAEAALSTAARGAAA